MLRVAARDGGPETQMVIVDRVSNEAGPDVFEPRLGIPTVRATRLRRFREAGMEQVVASRPMLLNEILPDRNWVTVSVEDNRGRR